MNENNPLPYEARVDLEHLLSGTYRRFGDGRAATRGPFDLTTARGCDQLNNWVSARAGLADGSYEAFWIAIRNAVEGDTDSAVKSSAMALLALGEFEGKPAGQRRKAAEIFLPGTKWGYMKYKDGRPYNDSSLISQTLAYLAKRIASIATPRLKDEYQDLLRQAVREARADDTDAVDNKRSQSGPVTTLLRRSERFRDELGRQTVGTRSGVTLYVDRSIQDRVVDILLDDPMRPVVVTGNAGYGKSTLLWGVCRDLEDRGARPLLVSATWLPGAAGKDAIYGATDLIDAIVQLDESEPSVVVLLDTADLLLHSEGSIDQTIELLASLVDRNIPVLAAVRPLEAEELNLGRTQIELPSYSDDEMDAATAALMREYFTEKNESDGVELIRAARTRQLPVLEICRSPLLLRLLFELAGPVLPSMELDVTGLYRSYWAKRVESDQRTARSGSGADLSALAEGVAIAMLVEGVPEIDINVLRDLLPRVRLNSVPVTSGSLEVLEQRGVVVSSNGGMRFFHQTLFEYAAARGLYERDGVAEAARLAEHMRAHPFDLFTGAVLEQLILLLGATRVDRAALTGVIHELIEDEHSTVSQIGMLAWAHLPDIQSPSDERLESLPQDALNRLMDALPQVWGASPDDVARTISRIWSVNPGATYHAATRTLARLAHRYPTVVAQLIEQLNVVRFFTGTGGNQNRIELHKLLVALAPSAPMLVRSLALVLLADTDSNETRLRHLHDIAEVWPNLADADFLQAVVETVDKSQAARDSSRRDVRLALGKILTAEADRLGWTSDDWYHFARETLAQVTSVTDTAQVGAGLAAIATHLGSLDESEEAERLVALVFSIEVTKGPPQIVSTLLAPLLAIGGVARRPLITEMRSRLEAGLPSPPNARGASDAQKWATAVRVALMDDRTPPSTVAEVTEGLALDVRDPWREPEYLSSLLAPSLLGGSEAARTVLLDLTVNAKAMSNYAQRRFLREAEQHLDADDDIATAFVATALRRKALGQLQNAALKARGQLALRLRSDDLEALVRQCFDGNDGLQRQGANLWRELQKQGVLQPSLEQVKQALSIARDPTAKATLLALIAPIVRGNGEAGQAAIETIGEYTRAHLTGERARYAPSIVDAAFDAWRMILAMYPTLNGWETLKELALQRRLVGAGAPDGGRVKDISTFLFNLLERGETDGVAICLADIGSALSGSSFSVNQRQSASNTLAPALTAFVQRANTDQLKLVTNELSKFPRVLAEVVLRTATRRPDGRQLVRDLLSTQSLPGDMAEYASLRLKGHRTVGAGPLPELLNAASARPTS